MSLFVNVLLFNLVLLRIKWLYSKRIVLLEVRTKYYKLLKSKFVMKRILLMFFVLSYLNTFAQEDVDLFSMSLEELMNIEVTTASKKAQKISDAPATVISYSAAQIELHGWRDLKDLFRALTGVDVSYDVQGEVKTLVTFRGVQGNQKVLVLQDGQRQNPITGERFIYGHNIPLNIYKRIEVVYGPASALYGADAYGGVINLITKDGADIDGMSASVGYVSTQAVDASMSFGKKWETMWTYYCMEECTTAKIINCTKNTRTL